jgi:hypothetical protein
MKTLAPDDPLDARSFTRSQFETIETKHRISPQTGIGAGTH